MANLLYVTNTSLDGYIEDETGAFNWENSDRVHPFIVELLRPVGTYLFGRRLYESMTYWDAPVENYAPQYRDFARLWRKPEKIVFSRTLTSVATPNSRVERDFNVDAIRKLKRESAHDIFIGGAELASLAIEADLVDECHLFVHPVIVGGGKPAFRAGLRRNLELLETRQVGTGALHLHYRIRGARS
jgi:dihydrofolate reductase